MAHDTWLMLMPLVIVFSIYHVLVISEIQSNLSSLLSFQNATQNAIHINAIIFVTYYVWNDWRSVHGHMAYTCVYISQCGCISNMYEAMW